MTRRSVDYNQLAKSYDRRYRVDSLPGLADALLGVASRFQRPAILEIGCGTGRWLREFESLSRIRCGADPSLGMLRNDTSGAELVNAHANALPFREASFDLIYSVNAFHHFYNPRESIGQAAALLRRSGVLAIIGIDPRTIRSRYFYDYFEGSRAIDMERYPSFGQQIDWMAEAGLDNIEHRIVHTWTSRFVGLDIFSDPFLQKESNSLLALLSNEEYQAGIERIKKAVDQDNTVVFDTVVPFGMVRGDSC